MEYHSGLWRQFINRAVDIRWSHALGLVCKRWRWFIHVIPWVCT